MSITKKQVIISLKQARPNNSM